MALPAVHRDAIVVASHTDIAACDVDWRRINGETRVIARRHLPTLQKGGVTVICDHIGGDAHYGYLPATRISTTPLQRNGSVEDVVAAVLALATAPYVTGVVLPVDGGRHLGV